MKTINVILSISLLLFLISCGSRSDKAAGVSEQQEIQSPVEGADVYEFDLEKSKVFWIGSKVVGKHNGTIDIKEGMAYMKDGKLVGGKAVIDMTTIIVLDITDPGTNAKLKGHLESDDFFSTDKFKISTFEISDVKHEGSTYTITGNLTIKDITHAITFALEVNRAEGKYYAKADFDIDRTLWDVRYGSGKFFDKLGDNMIYDNFNIRFDVVTKNM